MLKTENLVILLTDIAGFTEATSLHSREQNQRILERHNSILLPIVKRFRGRHIKSIGDALLLAFTSPTDGMRCAMAMQDAIHEYNQTAPKDEEIHIRVAASLGEVRVTKGDIFGEPVNVTSRIEGITPGDEIYFSEAVYLAMNKAEVPAIEIGLKELKGIPKAVRIFAIPRFAQTHLVPDPDAVQMPDPRFGFPFGGMHLSASPVANITMRRQAAVPTNPWVWVLGGTAICLAALTTYLLLGRSSGFAPVAPTNAAPQQVAPQQTAQAVAPVSNEGSPPTKGAAQVDGEAQPVPTGAGTTDSPVQGAVATAVPTKKAAGFMNMVQLEAAYDAGRISEQRYDQLKDQLEDEMDRQIERAELDYDNGKISKETYRRRVADIERRYEGED